MAQEFNVKEVRTESYEVPIYGRVTITPERDVTVVDVGNTGFRLRFFRNPSEGPQDLFDFVPERNYGENRASLGKHAMMLGFSLYEIYKWIKKHDREMKGLSQRVGEIGWVKAFTNPRLIKSIEGLFSEFGHPELVLVVDDVEEGPKSVNKWLSLDLKGLAELEASDELIKRLNFCHERAKDYTVSVKKEG